jgi:hypothetical protein
MSTWTAIATPSAVMVAEDVRGSHRVIMGPFPSTRAIRRRAYTISRPIPMRTAARPTLNATIRKSRSGP